MKINQDMVELPLKVKRLLEVIPLEDPDQKYAVVKVTPGVDLLSWPFDDMIPNVVKAMLCSASIVLVAKVLKIDKARLTVSRLNSPFSAIYVDIASKP